MTILYTWNAMRWFQKVYKKKIQATGAYVCCDLAKS